VRSAPGPRGPIGPAGATGADGATRLFSIPGLALVATSLFNQAGGTAIGSRCFLSGPPSGAARPIDGFSFVWKHSGTNRTIRCSHWDKTGTRVTYVDILVTATGLVPVTYGTPISVPLNELFTVSCCDMSGQELTGFTNTIGNGLKFPGSDPGAGGDGPCFHVGDGLVCVDPGLYYSGGAGFGDGYPATGWAMNAGIGTMQPNRPTT